jgi:hypothetical protein
MAVVCRERRLKRMKSVARLHAQQSAEQLDDRREGADDHITKM